MRLILRLTQRMRLTQRSRTVPTRGASRLVIFLAAHADERL
jgi:hypothetical protein